MREKTVIAKRLKCRMPGCESLAGDRRQLCDTDYQLCWNLVNEGTATWEEIEAARLCRPSQRTRTKQILEAVIAVRNR